MKEAVKNAGATMSTRQPVPQRQHSHTFDAGSLFSIQAPSRSKTSEWRTGGRWVEEMPCHIKLVKMLTIRHRYDNQSARNRALWEARLRVSKTWQQQEIPGMQVLHPPH